MKTHVPFSLVGSAVNAIQQGVGTWLNADGHKVMLLVVNTQSNEAEKFNQGNSPGRFKSQGDLVRLFKNHYHLARQLEGDRLPVEKALEVIEA